MKKILFVITDLEMGGAERVLVDLVNNLCDTFEIEILTIYSKGILEKDVDSKIKIYSLNKNSYNELNFIKKKIMSLKVLTKSYRKKIYKKYCNDKDVVISFLEGPATKLLSDSKNKKIAWIHTDLKIHYSNKNEKIIEKDYLKYNKLVFVSDSSKNSFDELFKNRMVNKEVVINNYIDIKRIINNSKKEINFKFKSPNFLVIARLVPAKGLERLINVHSLLVEQGLNHYIYVIGDGPLRSRLEEKINFNNIKETFILLGQKSNPYPYLNYCNIFLLPSLYEGLPVSATEAKILNKRIITTKTGVIDVLKDYTNKVICENNENDLYEVMKKELKNGDICKDPKKHIFNNDNIINEIKKLIEEVKND